MRLDSKRDRGRIAAFGIALIVAFAIVVLLSHVPQRWKITNLVGSAIGLAEMLAFWRATDEEAILRHRVFVVAFIAAGAFFALSSLFFPDSA